MSDAPIDNTEQRQANSLSLMRAIDRQNVTGIQQ
jgi:hypothetical protein